MNFVGDFLKKTDFFDRIGLGLLVILLIIFISVLSSKNTTVSQVPNITPTRTPNDFSESSSLSDSTPTTIPTKVQTENVAPTKQFVSASTNEVTPTTAPTIKLTPTLTLTPTQAVITPTPTLVLTSTPVLILTPTLTLTPTPSPTLKPTIIYPAGVNVSTHEVSLYPGEKQQIIATVLPTNAYNRDITWTYDGNIISVEPSGLITAKNAGRTTITVKTSNNKTNLIYVTINPTLVLTSTPSPTLVPTNTPTLVLTATPTRKPTLTPTKKPTLTPTVRPTNTIAPTATPTKNVSNSVLLKFAVMADIHNNTSGLKNMMKRVKTDGMNITLLAGDLTTDGTSSQLVAVKNVLDNSGARYELTEGNHDMRKNLFNSIFGKSFQSIKINGVKLILIDNSDYRGLDSGVLKGKGQKAWIESEVAECKKIICIGIMHMPLNHPTSGHIMGEENQNAASEAIWLRKLLVSSGVKEIETGHIHHFATYTIDGLKTNQVGPGTSSDFSEFTVYGSGKISRSQINL